MRLSLMAAVFFMTAGAASAGDFEPGISALGLSGNLVMPGNDGNPLISGVAARAFRIGPGSGGYDGMPRTVMFRGELDGHYAAGGEAEAMLTQGALQVRAGVGKLEEDGWYYMPMGSLNYMGRNNGTARTYSHVAIAGGELGKQVLRSSDTYYVGVFSGLGVSGGVQGTEYNEKNELGAHHLPNRASVAFGASLHAMFGKPNTKGTVVVAGNGAWLQNAGTIVDASADYNLSKNIQVGAGFRRVQLNDPGRDPIDVVSPYARVTLVGHGR